MRNKKLIVLTTVVLAVLGCAAQAYAQYWDSVLDKAYRYTFLDREFLEQNIEKYEARYNTTLHDYNTVLLRDISGKSASNVAVELAESDIIRDQPSDMYMRAAVGQFLEYLQSNQKQYLNNAMLLISELEDSYDAKRDYLFWALFIKGHKQLAEGDRAGLIDTIHSIWRDVLIPLNKERMTGMAMRGEFAADFEYHCVNLLNLTINKAIVGKRMSGLFPVGGVVEDVTGMLPENEEYYRNIMKRFQGRSSDSSNINYTVAFAMGEASGGMLRDSLSSSEYEKVFKEALSFYNLAYEWADTDKGRAAVLIRKSVLLDVIWSVKLNKSDAVDTPYFGGKLTELSQQHIESCYDMYSRLARRKGERKDIIHDNGFYAESDEYLTTMKNLWQNTGYLVDRQSAFLDKSGREDLMKWAEINHAEQVVFAHKYFSEDGYRDIIPENAYFLVSQDVAFLADKCLKRAIDIKTKEKQQIAFSLITYATMLNPLNLYDLLEFTVKSSDDGWPADYSRQFFIPMGDMLTDTIRLCSDDDRYAGYSQQLKSLSENISRYLKRLPQVVAYTRGGTSRSVAVKDSFILGSVFNALIPHFPLDRVKLEMYEFVNKQGLDNPLKVLQQNMAADMAGLLSGVAVNNKQFAPYDFYALYKVLWDKPEDDLQLFLERLFYANREALNDRANWKLKSVRDQVLRLSQGLVKNK